MKGEKGATSSPTECNIDHISPLARKKYIPNAAQPAGFHAFLGFSLQIPAIALLFAFVLGIGWSQSFSSEKGSAR